MVTTSQNQPWRGRPMNSVTLWLSLFMSGPYQLFMTTLIVKACQTLDATPKTIQQLARGRPRFSDLMLVYR